GTTTLCFDGQNFFDTDHPVLDPDGAIVIDGENYSPVSNFDTGTGPAWYLLDTSRAVRPIIWQEREKYEFQNVTRLNDERVFMTDNFLYGVRARANAGFGLWQLAHASRQPLTAANYAAIRAKMQTLTGDQGRPLGIRPNVLVVPPQLEEPAFHLLNTETQDGGGSNPWKGTAEIVVTPYLGG
ncbi:Mu-like prophage major head subunit gpT family protein, partial [Paracoccus spongiarum]